MYWGASMYCSKPMTIWPFCSFWIQEVSHRPVCPAAWRPVLHSPVTQRHFSGPVPQCTAGALPDPVCQPLLQRLQSMSQKQRLKEIPQYLERRPKQKEMQLRVLQNIRRIIYIFTFYHQWTVFLSQVRLLTLRILSQFEAELPPQTEVQLSIQILN